MSNEILHLYLYLPIYLAILVKIIALLCLLHLSIDNTESWAWQTTTCHYIVSMHFCQNHSTYFTWLTKGLIFKSNIILKPVSSISLRCIHVRIILYQKASYLPVYLQENVCSIELCFTCTNLKKDWFWNAILLAPQVL